MGEPGITPEDLLGSEAGLGMGNQAVEGGSRRVPAGTMLRICGGRSMGREGVSKLSTAPSVLDMMGKTS